MSRTGPGVLSTSVLKARKRNQSRANRRQRSFIGWLEIAGQGVEKGRQVGEREASWSAAAKLPLWVGAGRE
jgi:hypothetical protein